MILQPNYDVVIIGGGPAGSSAAAILAQEGWDVLVVEKQTFPRYCIGESLLPYCYFALDKIGMLDKMKTVPFVKKYSVQFVSTDGRASTPFYFHTHMNHEASQTWQVVRSEFDQMLLDNAAEKGANVLVGATVKELIEEDDQVVGVIVETPEGDLREVRAKMTIDASGRDAFAQKKQDWRKKDPYLNKVAVWTYYEGAKRDPGIDEGATTVAYVPEKGWFWYIPQHNNMVSVGIVAEPSYLYREGREPQRMFEREIENNVWLREHLAVGKPTGKFFHTGDYSYRSLHCAKDGLLLVGDAYAFLDPVFSSGVFLALKSGVMGAEIVSEALKRGDVSAENFTGYAEDLCAAIEAMRNLVYAFYDQAFSFRDLIKKYPHLTGDVTDCLIGNLSKDFGPLFEAVSEFAKLPPPLPHGRPLVAVS